MTYGCTAGDRIQVAEDGTFEVLNRGGNLCLIVLPATPPANADIAALSTEFQPLGGIAGMGILAAVTTKALIFDFDGLLMDTETTLLESWRWEWQRHGLDLDPVGFFANHGGDANESRYAALAEAVGPAYDRASSHALRMGHRAALNAALEPAPGVVSWLERAAKLGLRLAVASSSDVGHVGTMLDRAGLRPRFEVLATGDEVTAHKPDPAVYLLALNRLGLPAREAVAFEDTAHGVAAAQAAGLPCVAVPNPHADRGRFTHADLLLPSAADLSLDAVLAALAS